MDISDNLRGRLQASIAEDLGSEDITTTSCVPTAVKGNAIVVAKATGVLCGVDVFSEVFRLLDPMVKLIWNKHDGNLLQPGDRCLTIRGSLRSILLAERTGLNFLQHLSGISTITSRYVEKVSHTKTRILDTRKTIPLWRDLQKHAVRTGGGYNHRQGLFDMFLIKENHIAAAGGIGNAIEKTLQYRKQIGSEFPIEIEVRNLDELTQTLDYSFDRVMLDNMSLVEMKRAVELVRGRCEIEASGGVNLETVTGIAETGVDFISVGSLTHSVSALDLSLLIE